MKSWISQIELSSDHIHNLWIDLLGHNYSTKRGLLSPLVTHCRPLCLFRGQKFGHHIKLVDLIRIGKK